MIHVSERPCPVNLIWSPSLVSAPQMLEAYDLADRYRSQGTRVVLGGLHVTALPDEAAAHADAIVIGEGEPVWRTLLDDCLAGRLQSRYASHGDWSLNHAPLPRFDLLNADKYNRLTVQTSRGCPLRCEFCASSILLTTRYKLKPISKVLAEIDRIRELWPRPFLEFADDNSFVNREYWRELLANLRTRKLRWFTECDLRVYQDSELLELMRAAGCREVLIGFESPMEDGLAGIELRTDWKHRRWGEYREAIGQIQSHGIRVNGCFVLGLDGHRTDVFDAVHDFARDSEMYDVQITLLTPFPGTPLYGRLKDAGRLLHDGEWNRWTLFDINFLPAQMSVEELPAASTSWPSAFTLKTVRGGERQTSTRNTSSRRCVDKEQGHEPSHHPRSVCDGSFVRRCVGSSLRRRTRCAILAIRYYAAKPPGLRPIPGRVAAGVCPDVS